MVVEQLAEDVSNTLDAYVSPVRHIDSRFCKSEEMECKVFVAPGPEPAFAPRPDPTVRPSSYLATRASDVSHQLI